MPHIPRTSIAPSSLASPGFVPQAPRKPASGPKPATPYRGNTQPVAEPAKQKNPMMGDKLSMKDWDVDPVKVIQQLLDKEITVDEYSGMVS